MTRLARSALLLLLLLVAVGAAYLLWWNPPRIDEQRIRETVYTSIQREAGASFYVTGTLDVATTTVVDNTRVLFPDMIGISLGTTRATVRVPGRVSYGFDVGLLTPDMIRVIGDVVEVEVPPLSVHAAEPDLSALDVETSLGWARMPASAQRAERAAIAHLVNALRQQGEAHLASSNQPKVNTARALEQLIVPVLLGTGVPVTRLRIHLGDGLIVESILAEG
jgi:hypothetical protein